MSTKKKVMCWVICLLFFPVGIVYAKGTIVFDPPYTLITKSRGTINIVSLSTKENDKHLYFKDESGRKGNIMPSEIKNLDGLVADIKAAQSRRDKLFQRPSQPAVRNKDKETDSSDEKRYYGGGSTILSYCQSKWDNDYRMVEYCVKNQEIARMHVSQMSGPIIQHCRDKWGINYEMVEYCMKKQTRAKHRLEQYEKSK